MVNKIGIVGLAVATALFAVDATTAQAQILGTFRWQTQPHCNVVSLTVVQQGAIFLLNGVDDLCGAGSAPVTGTTTVTTSGAVLGFTVSTPAGRPVHITATVSLSTLAGSWIDGEGNAGPFTFSPAAVTGSPRPMPTSRVLSATVNTSGVLLRGIGAVSASRIGNTYQVDFDREIAACTVGVSVVDTQSSIFATVYAAAVALAANPRVVRVAGFTSNGTFTLLPFTVTVVCP